MVILIPCVHSLRVHANEKDDPHEHRQVLESHRRIAPLGGDLDPRGDGDRGIPNERLFPSCFNSVSRLMDMPSYLDRDIKVTYPAFTWYPPLQSANP